MIGCAGTELLSRAVLPDRASVRVSQSWDGSSEKIITVATWAIDGDPNTSCHSEQVTKPRRFGNDIGSRHVSGSPQHGRPLLPPTDVQSNDRVLSVLQFEASWKMALGHEDAYVTLAGHEDLDLSRRRAVLRLVSQYTRLTASENRPLSNRANRKQHHQQDDRARWPILRQVTCRHCQGEKKPAEHGHQTASGTPKLCVCDLR